MMFTYEAASATGTVVAGELEAVNQKEALRTLNGMGLTVTEIRGLSDARQPSRKKSTKQDLVLSFHEMATLLESGVTVSETIAAQSSANYPQDLHEQYQVMAAEITKGSSFSDALVEAGFDLPEYFAQLVRAGELTGNLGGSLREGVTQLEYDLHSREEFRSALMYPSILVASGIAAVLLIFIFVVPKFAPLVSRSDELPLLSLLVLNGGMWFNDNWVVVLLLIVLAAAAGSTLSANQWFRHTMLEFSFRLPVIGNWLHEADTATWSSLMATLLRAKVSLLDAMQLSGEAVRSEKRQQLFGHVSGEVRAGQSLAEALEKTKALTPTGYNLISSGEKTGKLPEMMSSLATLYKDAARTRLTRMLALIEPLAILVIGGAIGVIILGVILAITSVNELVV